ncbi:hypothetical protein PQ465_14460 [Sphingobacterium oryzagri]|uniref:DUF4890 domain-containing protein n=1 Tax=Sphingobacterium oryzagri TaxID=3025669 RepID=A0ABY7WGJ3_9SPHI|nr:hypothetical protein [Sphingobacterium sp. KACC 22765]WDF67498.1 hypothetical protein PQ465_14460 [Sphingobacterium sp. KACC 22765]
MKKFMLTGLSLLFALTLTFAQEGTPEEKAKTKTEKISEKVTLTPEQQTAVYAIVLEHTKAKWALKSDKSVTPDVAKQQAEALAASADAKIAEQLTAEQKTLYAEYVKERHEKKK